MYTSQQVANSIASNSSMPGALHTYKKMDTAAGEYQETPYKNAPTGLAHEFDLDRKPMAYAQDWGRPDLTQQSYMYEWTHPGAPAPAQAEGGMSPHLLGPGGTQTAYSQAVQAFDLTNDSGCMPTYESEKQSLYADHRLFGNLRLSQGNSDVGAVLLGGKATIVNPTLLSATVQGLNGQMYTTPDAYKDDSASFVPFATQGGSAGGIRPELYVGTVSEGLSAPPKQESLNLRSFLPTDMPSSFNIYPESESAAARKQNTCRLNRIQQNYIKSRLTAAANMDW